MEQKIKEKKRFSIIARVRSANHAWRGIRIFFKSTHNAWIHIYFIIMAVYLGFLLQISRIEWMILMLAIGMVMFAETFNTAIEIDIDLTSPNYHPYARDTKDVAAGAVLIASIIAAIIGLMIFLPKILLVYNIVI